MKNLNTDYDVRKLISSIPKEDINNNSDKYIFTIPAGFTNDRLKDGFIYGFKTKKGEQLSLIRI